MRFRVKLLTTDDMKVHKCVKFKSEWEILFSTLKLFNVHLNSNILMYTCIISVHVHLKDYL
jgi:hypothetical protein